MKFNLFLGVVFTSLLCTPLYAQKSIRLINHGKYEKAEAVSREKLTTLKAEYSTHAPGREYFPHEYKDWITPYHALGLIHRVKGDFSLAEKYFAKADSVYALFKTAMDKKETSTSWVPSIRYSVYGIEIMKGKQTKRYFLRRAETARIYMALGELDSAKTTLHHTLNKMTQAYGQKTSMAKTTYAAFGEYYAITNQFDSSRYFYEKYINALYSDPNYFDISIKHLSDAYYGLAQSYLGTGDIETAIKAADKSNHLSRHRFVKRTDGKNYLGKIATANLLAEAYRRDHNYKSALRWNNKAFKLYNSKINLVSPDKLPVLATRGQIFWANADTASANKCFREMVDIFFSYTQNNFSYLSEPERAYFYRHNKHFIDLAKGYYQYLYFQEGYQNNYIASRLYEIHLNNKGVLLNSSSKLLNEIYARGDSALINQYLDIRKLRESKTRLIQSGDMKKVASLDRDITQKERALRNQLSIESEKFVFTNEIISSIPDSTNLIDVLKCKTYERIKTEGNGKDGFEIREAADSRYLYFVFDGKSGMKLLQNDITAKQLETRYYKAYLNFAKNDIQSPEVFKGYFEPLKGSLSYRKLILSGDGIYNLVNPEILFDGKEYLINQYQFLSVVSAKDLLKQSKQKPRVTDITLIGYPDYSTHLEMYKESPVDLPGTAVEIQGIEKTIPTNIPRHVYIRRNANEVTVKEIPSTSVLHFATHGFFETATLKDPMHTSGLVLALSDSLDRNREDGFLTAFEASNLDLKKTFLVVLSACETGQGEFEDGEGVWGLQRAFQVAGVRYTIMSLFKVNDEVTASLMQQFYSNMILGDEVLTAFRKAQMNIKAKYSRPVEWGAFVVKGY